MRIGIVCEGRSDYPALESFIGGALSEAGIEAQFRPLFPDMDNTRPDGGWGHVLLWFTKYPVATRIQRFFAGGLFGGELGVETLDAIVIQLDTDVVDDPAFKNFVRDQYLLSIEAGDEPAGRAAAICAVIDVAMQSNDMTDADRKRHVAFPAVESTESWCVAAFSGAPIDAESLRGADLTTAFMRALEMSESKEPKDRYAQVDKDFARRRRFCEKHARNHDRVRVSCPHFRTAMDDLISLN